MKIAIIGYSGSGKSTLAQALGQKYRCPVLHLDTVHFLPGWVDRPLAEEQAILARFLEEHSAWVIDGNYSRTHFDRRMEQADQIIFLDFGRAACFCRALRRYLANRGQTRASAAPGCPEKFDREFARWILHGGRTAKHRAHYQSVLRRWGGKTVVLKNQRQLSAYCRRELQCKGATP